MTSPRTLPRFSEMLATGKPAGMSRRRRALVTQDGNTIAQDEARPVIVYGESLPIWGEPIAMDARPTPSLDAVTFDRAMPSKTKGTRR